MESEFPRNELDILRAQVPMPVTTDRYTSDVGFRCPKCGSSDVRRSKAEGFWDALLRLRGHWPFRCRSCRFRFHRPS